MASYEEYKEKFKDLAAKLKAADSSLNIVDHCSAIEAEIKADIAECLEMFKTYKDLSLIERATFLGMARDTIHLAALKAMLHTDTAEDLETFANGSIENLIFATDLMICERDGKSKWSLYDDVH